MEEIQALASTCRIAQVSDAVLNTECCYTFYTPYTTNAEKEEQETHGIENISGGDGLVVDLETFVGTIPNLADCQVHKKIYVRIVKERMKKESTKQQEDEKGGEQVLSSPPPPPPPPTKLAIGVEGGFYVDDQSAYDTISTYSVVVLAHTKIDNNSNNNSSTDDSSSSSKVYIVSELPYTYETKSAFPDQVVCSVDSIIHHAGLAIQQDLHAWQASDDDQIPISKYAARLPFVDNGVTISPDSTQWKCAFSGATENLWLNLSDGYIGDGRRHWDGSGGHNGAMEHYNSTGQQYPLVVKLGTITAADLNTADCYSYAPDEDGPVQIPNLAELLMKRGIHISTMQKTVKSTAELEVELNANYDFAAITEAGTDLIPVSGPGLQGLQNLGNSCYMNSVLQLLLSGTVPELVSRYGLPPNTPVTQHSFLQRPDHGATPRSAPTDLLCQTIKVACALTSGAYTRPIVVNREDSNDNQTEDVDEMSPQYRVAPRMFKHVIGRNHVDFSTAHQQDATQFLQYFFEQLDRSELKSDLFRRSDDGVDPFKVTSHLFQFQMTSRMVCVADGKVKYKESAPETIWGLRLPMDKAQFRDEGNKEVTEEKPGTPEPKRLKSDDAPSLPFGICVDEWAAETVMEDVYWSHLNSHSSARTQVRWTNFPRYLLIQAQRYTLGPDWAPIKLEVNLDIPQEIDLTAYRSTGPEEGEELVPDEGEGQQMEMEENNDTNTQSQNMEVDEEALTQLMDMGFSRNGSKRALLAVGGNNVEAATGWVFEHIEDADFDDPVPYSAELASIETSGQGTATGVDEGVVMSLVENLGCFTPDQVRAALKETNSAADRAADWLFSHMDDLDSAIAALESQTVQSVSSAGLGKSGAPKLPLDDGEGKYTMMGIISHIGRHTGSGHYVAHLKKDDGKWVIFNDEKVALSSKPPFEHAYLYLFQRNDTIGTPLTNF